MAARAKPRPIPVAASTSWQGMTRGALTKTLTSALTSTWNGLIGGALGGVRLTRHVVFQRTTLHVIGGFLFASGVFSLCVGATHYAKTNVLGGGLPAAVVLIDPPTWMSQTLVTQITQSVSSPVATAADDGAAVREVAGKLHAHPWVAGVQEVRRVYGKAPGDTIEVKATFRAPVALVRDGDWYWMVDSTGVKLPERFAVSEVPTVVVSPDRELNFRIITGVRAPAPAAGSLWTGEDVRAGLDLAALFADKPFGDEIVVIDVSNYGGRVEQNLPQLVLKTRFDTQIGWGRPVKARDFFVEISNDMKLQRLQEFKNRTGRVDAGRDYIDIRMETPMARPKVQPVTQMKPETKPEMKPETKPQARSR